MNWRRECRYCLEKTRVSKSSSKFKCLACRRKVFRTKVPVFSDGSSDAGMIRSSRVKERYFQFDRETAMWTYKSVDQILPNRDLATLIQSKLASENPDWQEFADLLRRMLDYTPDARITPAEAINHPFFLNRPSGPGFTPARILPQLPLLSTAPIVPATPMSTSPGTTARITTEILPPSLLIAPLDGADDRGRPLFPLPIPSHGVDLHEDDRISTGQCETRFDISISISTMPRHDHGGNIVHTPIGGSSFPVASSSLSSSSTLSSSWSFVPSTSSASKPVIPRSGHVHIASLLRLRALERKQPNHATQERFVSRPAKQDAVRRPQPPAFPSRSRSVPIELNKRKRLICPPFGLIDNEGVENRADDGVSANKRLRLDSSLHLMGAGDSLPSVLDPAGHGKAKIAAIEPGHCAAQPTVLPGSPCFSTGTDSKCLTIPSLQASSVLVLSTHLSAPKGKKAKGWRELSSLSSPRIRSPSLLILASADRRSLRQRLRSSTRNAPTMVAVVDT